MFAFDSATALERISEGGVDGAAAEFRWDVPDGWHQGRGAWGGLVVGAIVRSVLATEPDPLRSARTVSLQISAPAMVGPHVVRVRPVRIGSGMSTWSASVVDSDGSAVAAGTVICGMPRAGEAGTALAGGSAVAAPEAPRADEVALVPTGPPFPEFTGHFEYRIVSGLPLQGGRAETSGWVSYREAAARWSPADLLALVDAWYTVTLVPLAGMERIGTVNFTANLLVDPASLVPGEPLLHHGLVTAAADGYASELRRLWTPDGRLAVENLQTVVVG